MAEETQNQLSPLPSKEGLPPKTKPANLLFGVAALVILLAAIIAILLLTGGDVSETKAPPSLNEAAAEGKQVFLQSNCNRCHPSDGRAGGIGPRLSTTNRSDEAIKNSVHKGQGSMPAYPQLNDDQLNKLVQYLRALKPV